MAHCRGFRPGCTNEATHTDMGYAFCLECARQFAGYTPALIEADNAALREALGLAIEQIGTDMHYVPAETEQRITSALDTAHPGAPLLERLADLLTAARAYRDAWQGSSLPMGPLACGAYWERLEAAITALDERE